MRRREIGQVGDWAVKPADDGAAADVSPSPAPASPPTDAGTPPARVELVLELREEENTSHMGIDGLHVTMGGQMRFHTVH